MPRFLPALIMLAALSARPAFAAPPAGPLLDMSAGHLHFTLEQGRTAALALGVSRVADVTRKRGIHP